MTMWSSLWLALFGLGVLATYIYTVRQEAIWFWSAIATAVWTFLALTGGRIVVIDGGEHVLSAGAAVYLLGGFALLSAFALVGNQFGLFPPDEDPVSDPDMRLQ